VSAEPDAVDGLTRVLVRACRQLAEAGQPRAAGRLAADGWKLLRAGHPRQAMHLDGAMHHIARMEAQLEARQDQRPTSKETAVPSEEPASTDDRILDVRTEIPRRRHELIFESFGKIAPGEAYVLVNDHDPKPLRYQFEAENAGEFSWEYLEEGPEVWRVRIGRVAAATG
jgi:uncharacterized protein (DUF2249 family)